MYDGNLPVNVVLVDFDYTDWLREGISLGT